MLKPNLKIQFKVSHDEDKHGFLTRPAYEEIISQSRVERTLLYGGVMISLTTRQSASNLEESNLLYLGKMVLVC